MRSDTHVAQSERGSHRYWKDFGFYFQDSKQSWDFIDLHFREISLCKEQIQGSKDGARPPGRRQPQQWKGGVTVSEARVLEAHRVFRCEV